MHLKYYLDEYYLTHCFKQDIDAVRRHTYMFIPNKIQILDILCSPKFLLLKHAEAQSAHILAVSMLWFLLISTMINRRQQAQSFYCEMICSLFIRNDTFVNCFCIGSNRKHDVAQVYK